MVKLDDKRFVYYRDVKNYKDMKVIRDTLNDNIEELYNNNVWNLKDGFKKLEEYNKDTNNDVKISWLEKIQYLDHSLNPNFKFNKISLTSFKNGEYKSKYTIDKTGNSIATEKAYANRIIFFTKNLPSFNQYIDNDNIDWIVKKNRLLFYEIFKYHNDNNNSIASFNKDLKVMARCIILLIGEQNELRYKYPVLSTDLKHFERLAEDENRVQSRSEIKSFVPYEQLLDIIDKLEQDYNNELNNLSKDKQNKGIHHSNILFDKHQILLALSLNILDYPSRNEKFTLSFIEDDNEVKDDGNYINIKERYCKLIFGSEKKKHKPLTYTLNSLPIRGLNNRLNKLLKYSYKIYPRKYLFISKLSWEKQQLDKVSPETVSSWLRELITTKNLGINGFRSAFVSYYYNNLNNYQKAILKTRMRTSKEELERNYLKNYKNPDDLIKVKIEPSNELISKVNKQIIIDEDDNEVYEVNNEPKQLKEKPILNIQDRKKNNFKKYYENDVNRKKHLERVKKYNNSILTVANRYVRELNKGLLEWSRIKEGTKEKFKLYVENNKYYTKIDK